MKQSLVSNSDSLKKQIKRNTILMSAVVGVVVVINVLLAVFRTDDTHTAFLLINIFSDIIAGCFVFAYVSFKIIPQANLQKLLCKQPTEVVCGKVLDISSSTQRVGKFDCLTVSILDKETVRSAFVIENTLKIQFGQTVTFTLCDNIATSVEVADD